MTFPSGYPYVPPVVKFTTPCFHPNVDQDGNICLDILKVCVCVCVCVYLCICACVNVCVHVQETWSALYDARTILLSIQSLLAGTFAYVLLFKPV